MEEIWRDIPGYEQAYQVSTFGRVRSLDRTRIVNNCYGGRSPRTDKGKILSPNDNGNGYLQVTLRKDGVKRPMYIHRLVAETFLDKPKNCNEVNHKDHNRKNNNIENLEWCNRKYNVHYSIGLMRKPKAHCRKSSTGIKYVTKKARNGRPSRYRVQIRARGIDKLFPDLNTAALYVKGIAE